MVDLSKNQREIHTPQVRTNRRVYLTPLAGVKEEDQIVEGDVGGISH